MSSRPQSPHHLAARECPRVRTHIAAPRGSQLHGRAPVFVASRSWRRSHAVCMTRLRTPSSFSAHAHAHLMGSSPRCHSSDLCVSACVRGVHAWAGAAWAHDPRRRLLCRRLIRADAQDNDPAHPVARGQQGLSACTTHYYRMRNACGRHASASSHDSVHAAHGSHQTQATSTHSAQPMTLAVNSPSVSATGTMPLAKKRGCGRKGQQSGPGQNVHAGACQSHGIYCPHPRSTSTASHTAVASHVLLLHSTARVCDSSMPSPERRCSACTACSRARPAAGARSRQNQTPRSAWMRSAGAGHVECKQVATHPRAAGPGLVAAFSRAPCCAGLHGGNAVRRHIHAC